jgi:hypothetical protein
LVPACPFFNLLSEETVVKTCFALFASASLAAATFAQQPSTADVKMLCRDLSTGTMAPNEALINGMACHVAGPQADPRIKNIEPKPVAANFVAGHNGQPLPAANRITAGATVFIAPQDGFENYLAAALQKKGVQLVAVSNPEHATYILKGSPKVTAIRQVHSGHAATVQLVDQKTGAILFAYSLDNKSSLHAQQSTAEACAKHHKEQIEKK